MNWPHPRPELTYRRLSVDPDSDLAVPLEEMKLDLRIDSSDEDETVTRLIRGMTDFFQVRTGWRLAPASFIAEAFEFDGCRAVIETGPLRAFERVEFWNAETKVWEELPTANFNADARGRDIDVFFDEPFPSGFPPIASLAQHRPVKMYFTAGFDPPDQTGTTVSGFAEDGMITCLKTLVALGYQTRETDPWNPSDASKDYLLHSYRRLW